MKPEVFAQAMHIIADLAAPPKLQVQQETCEHVMWLCFIPDGEARCRKCGFTRPITDEEWESF